MSIQVQDERPGAMVAILCLPAASVRSLCTAVSHAGLIALANLNAPTQFVVTGDEAAVQKLVELVDVEGQGTAIRLQVTGGFHCSLMTPMQAHLIEVMQRMTWKDVCVPLVANVSGTFISTAQQVRQALIDQIVSPVQWISCVESLVNAGCNTFLELGSGQVLSKLVRSVAPGVETFAADTPEKLLLFAKTCRELVRN